VKKRQIEKFQSDIENLPEVQIHEAVKYGRTLAKLPDFHISPIFQEIVRIFAE